MIAPQSTATRRQFLVSAAALASQVGPASTLMGAQPDSVVLSPSLRNLFRVRVELEVEGNVDVPRNPLVSRRSETKLPIKSEAVFDYEERYHFASGRERGLVTGIDRYYHEARNRSRLNRSQFDSQLRDSVRDTVIRRDRLPEVIYAVDDYFQRDELDLLRLPASSAAVDQLLPVEAVSEGSRYTISPQVIGSILNLSSVEQSDVSAEVVFVSSGEARIQFRGKVNGSVEGVPTVVRTIGKLTFDRTAGTCTWLAMAVHETRDIGTAEPGFDVAATIKMVRRPMQQPVALRAPAGSNVSGPIPIDRLYVDVQSEQLGLSALVDRSWRMMNDVPGAAMMRKVENDRSIAQCDFRPLAALQPGQQWTLEAFQGDVQQTLGEQLSQLIEADERVSSTGLRVLRVVALGAVEEVPIQWIMLHFSDDSGRRVLATFTMEGRNAEAFAGADAQLADSLRFLELPPREPEELTQKSPQEREATKVAESISGENRSDEVQSASDLR